MRESTLKKLYFGKISPWERECLHDPEYTALSEKINDLVDRYKKLLPPEEYEKFEELQNLQGRAGCMVEADLFAYAFCTGVLLMIDVFGFRET